MMISITFDTFVASIFRKGRHIRRERAGNVPDAADDVISGAGAAL